MAAWASLLVLKPALVSLRRSSVSRSLPPQEGQLSSALRSTRNLLPQAWQRCAGAMPTSTMYSKLALPLLRM